MGNTSKYNKVALDVPKPQLIIKMTTRMGYISVISNGQQTRSSQVQPGPAVVNNGSRQVMSREVQSLPAMVQLWPAMPSHGPVKTQHGPPWSSNGPAMVK